MLMAAASGVKTVRGLTWSSKQSGFALSRSRNNRFAFASRKVALVFRGAIGGGGLAATDAHPVQRQPHALGRNGRAFRAQRARIDAHPRNLRGQPAIFDLRAAVHDDLETGGLRL